MIILLCSPARAGKDTIADMYCDIFRDHGHNCQRYVLAKSLKEHMADRIQEKYGVSVWDDSQKHLFRQDLIDEGVKLRNETNGRFLIDKFLDAYSNSTLNTTWVISDFRFIDEYNNICDYVEKYGTRVVPLYIERYAVINGNKFVLEPSIKEEIKEYSKIKKICKVIPVKWTSGLFWKKKLERSLPYPL